jgi:hypothetical protein
MVLSVGLCFISYLLCGYILLIMECVYMVLNSHEQCVCVQPYNKEYQLLVLMVWIKLLTGSQQQHQTQCPYSAVLNISVNKCNKKNNHHDNLTKCDRWKMGQASGAGSRLHSTCHVWLKHQKAYKDVTKNMQSGGGHLNSWLWQSTPCT